MPRSYFCSGSGDAVGRHLLQTFNFAVCSHRVPALDCARDIASQRGNAMKLPRRRFLHLAAGAAALPAVSRIARAQSYPTRPIRLLVPFPRAGRSTPSVVLGADKIKSMLGSVIVENRWRRQFARGCRGRTRPPGRLHPAPGQVDPSRHRVDPQDPAIVRPDQRPGADLKHCRLGFRHRGPSVGAGSHPQRACRLCAKANPGELSYGSPGVGALPHLTVELLKSLAETPDITHVPYRGARPALTE